MLLQLLKMQNGILIKGIAHLLFNGVGLGFNNNAGL